MVTIFDYEPKTGFDAGTPGLYRNVPPHVYHTSPLPSHSVIAGLFDEPPAKVRHALDAGWTPAESLDFGSAFHAMLMEPGRFMDGHTTEGGINPKTQESYSWDSAAYQKARTAAAADGKVLIRTQWDLEKMVASVLAVPNVRSLIEAGGEREISMVWEEPVTRAVVRSRFDFLSLLAECFIDFKKTRGAGREFDSNAASYGYISQMAMYHDGMQMLTGRSYDGFIVATEDAAPNLTAVIRFGATLDDDHAERIGGSDVPPWLHCGRNAYRWALAKYLQCKRTGEWPGFDERSYRVPTWYMEKWS